MIENGKTVKIHYTGNLADGTVFDSSDGRDPLEFETGAGTVIPGIDKAVCEMDVGETRTVNIPCAEAYGEVRDEMVGAVPREQLPDDLSPEVGMMLEMRSDDQVVPVRIIEVADDAVTIDANHPLAGQDLTFEVTLVAVD